MNENMDNLFVTHDLFGRIWSLVSNWSDFVTVHHNEISAHLDHFL